MGPDTPPQISQHLSIIGLRWSSNVGSPEWWMIWKKKIIKPLSCIRPASEHISYSECVQVDHRWGWAEEMYSCRKRDKSTRSQLLFDNFVLSVRGNQRPHVTSNSQASRIINISTRKNTYHCCESTNHCPFQKKRPPRGNSNWSFSDAQGHVRRRIRVTDK